MPKFVLSHHIAAPVSDVFATATDLERMPGRIKGIIRIERLTPEPTGVGTRFCETRLMFKREATETFEYTQFEAGRSYEIVANSCGVEYTTTFHFAPDAAGTRVDVTVNTRAVRLWAKLFSPLAFLMMGMMKKCILDDLEQLGAAITSPTQPA